MVCPSCGNDNTQEFKFCPECGERLGATVAAPAPASARAAPIARVDEAAQATRLLEQAFELYDADQYEEALGCCQASLALDPGGSTAHSLLGMIYERMGKTAEAVQQYQLVLRMNPDSIADAIKLEALVSGPTKAGHPALDRWRRWMPAAAAAVAAALVIVAGSRATSRAIRRAPVPNGRIAAHTLRTPVPGPSMPPAPTTPVGEAGPAPSTASTSATSGAAVQNRESKTQNPLASLPAPPPANTWPGLRGAYSPASRASRSPGELSTLAAGPVASRRAGRENRSGYLATAPILGIQKIDPGQDLPPANLPGPSLPPATAARPRSARGSAPVLPPVTDAGEARVAAAAPAAPAAPASAPPSASISIQPLDDSQPAAPARAAPALPAQRPASLQDALQHQQMAAYYRRQGDNQAASSEYRYARDLFQQVRQRGGREAAIAAEGAAAAQTGLSRLQGP